MRCPECGGRLRLRFEKVCWRCQHKWRARHPWLDALVVVLVLAVLWPESSPTLRLFMLVGVPVFWVVERNRRLRRELRINAWLALRAARRLRGPAWWRRRPDRRA